MPIFAPISSPPLVAVSGDSGDADVELEDPEVPIPVPGIIEIPVVLAAGILTVLVVVAGLTNCPKY